MAEKGYKKKMSEVSSKFHCSIAFQHEKVKNKS